MAFLVLITTSLGGKLLCHVGLWPYTQVQRTGFGSSRKRSDFDYAAAEGAYGRALKLSPGHPLLHLNLGLALFKQERYAADVGG